MLNLVINVLFAAAVSVGLLETFKKFGFEKAPSLVKTIVSIIVELLVAAAVCFLVPVSAISSYAFWLQLVVVCISTVAFALLGYDTIVKFFKIYNNKNK